MNRLAWLADYVVACAIATGALVVVFIGGFAAGNWAGPGASTAAAQNYAHGLQGEWEAETELKLGDAARACAVTTNRLTDQIAQLQRDHAKDQQDYSERIIGLREQLRGHGLVERIVRAAR